MSRQANSNVRPFGRAQAPAAPQSKRPNGHKVQLALKREIEGLHTQLEREKKAIAAARQTTDTLESQLFSLENDRDRWKRRTLEHEKSVEKLEGLLGIPSTTGKTWEERQEQLAHAVMALRSS